MGIEAVHSKTTVHGAGNAKKAKKAETDKGASIYSSQKKEKPKTEEQLKFEKANKHMMQDFHSGILTRGSGLTPGEKILKFFGKKYETDNVIFDYKAYEKKFGKSPTYGEISRRYNLPPQTLKKANGLYFEAHEADKRGYDLNQYRPDDLASGSYEIKFPADVVKKNLKAIDKD